MRKQLIIQLLAVSALLSITSCKKWLDIQPRTRIKSDVLLQTEQGYRDALIGCYTLMNNQSLYGRELSFGFVDAASIQYDVFSNAIYNNVAGWKYMTDAAVRTQIDNIWGKMYNVLANVNNILDNIDTDKDIFTGDDYALIKGEALTMRAYIHLDLLRLFAPSDLSKMAIPYVSTLTTKVTRAGTGTETITAILQDLKDAAILLQKDPILKGNKLVYTEDEFLNNRHQRFNYYAAKAIAARASLWKGDKTNALANAQEVIDAADRIFPWIQSANISATNDKDKDLTFSTENILALNVVDLKNIANTWFIAALPSNQLLRGAYYFEGMFEKTTIGANDYRLLFTSRLINNNYIIYKYYQPDNYKAAYANMIPLIRRSEMNYIAAECYAGIDNAKAAAYLNEVRSHRGITTPLSNSLSDASVMGEILKEYRKEFQGEGQLFQFCKRTNQAKFPTSSKLLTDEQYVLPKPNDEIEFGGY
ncbi:MAG: RagB/SusD family nutrient uptake outer membrane protein [Chitinophagaceae bacterium]|nr:RagB/SusD family nutrient uptake outer membrane protein [Chitinophagaceae bacterium]